jgi:hypothetical protein
MNRQLDGWIGAAREALEQFLAGPEASEVDRYAGRIGLTAPLGFEALQAIVRSRAVPARWKTLWSQLGENEPLIGRWLLAHGALRSLDQIRQLPVSNDVRRLICGHYRLIAQLVPPNDAIYLPSGQEFREMAEIVLLCRFVAGRLHWKISGIPRSWVFKMKWRDSLRTLLTVARAGGWRPYFETHLSSRGAPLLIEAEYKQCYLRIAESMNLQPEILGVVGASWLHAEETIQISPHLAWLNTLFLANGGFLVHLGLAAKDSGFMVGSKQRRELYESGLYLPRNAMYVWPRKAFLNWAHQQVPARLKPAARAVDAAVN